MGSQVIIMGNHGDFPGLLKCSLSTNFFVSSINTINKLICQEDSYLILVLNAIVFNSVGIRAYIKLKLLYIMIVAPSPAKSTSTDTCEGSLRILISQAVVGDSPALLSLPCSKPFIVVGSHIFVLIFYVQSYSFPASSGDKVGVSTSRLGFLIACICHVKSEVKVFKAEIQLL